jgi:thiol:disulfide interchange protein DsbD
MIDVKSLRGRARGVWLAFLAGALVLPFASTAQIPQNPARWTFAPLPPAAGQGLDAAFDATITLDVDRGWKVYSLTTPPPPPTGGPNALTIRLAEDQPYVAAGPVRGPDPYRFFDPNWQYETEVYKETGAFVVPVRRAADVGAKPGGDGLPNVAAPQPPPLRVRIRFQTCNDTLCLPPREIELTPGATSAPPPGARSTAAAGMTSPSAPGIPAVPDLAAASRANTLGAYIGLAALMGALSLLTPCVFPMVPITVSYFTNRPNRTRREAVVEASVYGLGIVLTFTAVGFVLAIVFGASGLNRFAADPWLNLGITALFVAFALSLFGLWEIALPSGLVNAAARADRGRGRFVGTMLMGLAFTLTSFTCTAPFLGTLLVVAAQGDWQWPMAGMLAFSSVFALPFVALALAPHWLKSLPRSGSWLLAVKAVMGMAELAAAMKFLSNVDLVWGWGVFTRDVVLVVWIAIALVLAVYLAGFLKLGRAPRLGAPKLGRAVAATGALALGIWLGTGLAGRRLGELEAFLPPADFAANEIKGELDWLHDYDEALAQAKRDNRPLLIDFTGYTCTNCRWMEANMFPKPEVERELARYVRVRLYTDGRDESNRRYQQMEQDYFGTVALPYYAVMTPDGVPVVAFSGLTRNPAEFVGFLGYYDR